MLCLAMPVPGAPSCTTKATAQQCNTQASRQRKVFSGLPGCAGVRSLKLQHSGLASVISTTLWALGSAWLCRCQGPRPAAAVHASTQPPTTYALPGPAGARSPELQHQSELVAAFLERTALLARPLSERQANGPVKAPSSNPGKPQPLPQRDPPSRLHSPTEPAQQNTVQQAAQPAQAQQQPSEPAGGDENGGSLPAEPVPAESPEALARQRAEEYKARGNEHHKAARWEAAIAEYTLAIETCPGVAAYHGNRQAACMGLARGIAPM